MTSPQSDRLSACASIANEDLWFDNGSVDGAKVTAFLGQLLRRGDTERFKQAIDGLESAEFRGKILQRLVSARRQYDGIVHALRGASSVATLRQVRLKPFDAAKREVASLEGIFSWEAGLYFRNKPSDCYADFDTDFESIGEDLRSILRERGFGRTVAKHSQERWRVLRGARFHTFDHNFYAVSDENGFYDAANAARLARLSYVNYEERQASEFLEKAIVLPIDHACNNYYHNLSECLSGLRFVGDLPSDVPIIYTEDRFGALDFIAARLHIDRARLRPMKSCGNLIIGTAVQLYAGNFTWDEDLCKFHRRIAYPQTDEATIYVSRRKAGRGPANEQEVEVELRRMGFKILFPEELDFSQQVLAFSNARVVVAPHGAGLTNILYMSSEGGIVEIFNSGFIQPDYYLRSRHNRMKYECLIQVGDTIDVDQLKSAIHRIL